MTNSTDDICQDEDDNDKTNSNGKLIKPLKSGDNMKDLKPLDFNSADDIRQSLKAVFTSKMPNLDENAEDYIGQNIDCDNDGITDKNQQDPALAIETDDCKLNNNKNYDILQRKKSTGLLILSKGNGKKRRGRPPKSGPSKKIKRHSVSAMYIGKLSNLVFSKRGNESDSDFDYVLL